MNNEWKVAMSFRKTMLAIFYQMMVTTSDARMIDSMDQRIVIAPDTSVVNIILCTDNIIEYEQSVRSSFQAIYPKTAFKINGDDKLYPVSAVIVIKYEGRPPTYKCNKYIEEIQHLENNIKESIMNMKSSTLPPEVRRILRNPILCPSSNYYDKDSKIFYFLAIEGKQGACRSQLMHSVF